MVIEIVERRGYKMPMQRKIRPCLVLLDALNLMMLSVL